MRLHLEELKKEDTQAQEIFLEELEKNKED